MINIDKQIYKDMLRHKKYLTQRALENTIYKLYHYRNEDDLYLEVFQRNVKGISTSTRAKIRHKVYPDDKELFKMTDDEIAIKMLEYIKDLLDSSSSQLEKEITRRRTKTNG